MGSGFGLSLASFRLQFPGGLEVLRLDKLCRIGEGKKLFTTGGTHSSRGFVLLPTATDLRDSISRLLLPQLQYNCGFYVSQLQVSL